MASSSPLKGYLQLFDFTAAPPEVNWSSGGFIADSIVDNDVISGSQQQYLTRNTQFSNWYGAVWNMVFVGDTNPPSGTWPSPPFTVVANTPVVREKPYLVVDSSNNYSVVVPALKQNSQGPSWNAEWQSRNIPYDDPAHASSMSPKPTKITPRVSTSHCSAINICFSLPEYTIFRSRSSYAIPTLSSLGWDWQH